MRWQRNAISFLTVLEIRSISIRNCCAFAYKRLKKRHSPSITKLVPRPFIFESLYGLLISCPLSAIQFSAQSKTESHNTATVLNGCQCAYCKVLCFWFIDMLSYVICCYWCCWLTDGAVHIIYISSHFVLHVDCEMMCCDVRVWLQMFIDLSLALSSTNCASQSRIINTDLMVSLGLDNNKIPISLVMRTQTNI